MKRILLIAGLGLVLVACGATKLATPSQADVDRVIEDYPEYTLVSLKEGQSLYLSNCGSCHGLKNPTSKTAEEWAKIVPKMVGMVNKKEVKLDDQSQDLILKYVTIMGTANTGN